MRCIRLKRPDSDAGQPRIQSNPFRSAELGSTTALAERSSFAVRIAGKKLLRPQTLSSCGVDDTAKSRTEAINKSQAILNALEAHPEKSPSEIAEGIKAKGLNVNAQYVSTIKSNAKAKDRKPR